MNEREGFTKSEINMMLLSHETREGLKLTGVTLIISLHHLMQWFSNSDIICRTGAIFVHDSWCVTIPK